VRLSRSLDHERVFTMPSTVLLALAGAALLAACWALYRRLSAPARARRREARALRERQFGAGLHQVWEDRLALGAPERGQGGQSR
jgi:hypothetical protein